MVLALAALASPGEVVALSGKEFSMTYRARASLDQNQTGRLVPLENLFCWRRRLRGQRMTRRPRASDFIVAMVATILVVPTLSAAAAEGDLASYFERAAAAEFSGDQVLACNTPVGLRDSAAHLAQRDGVLYISAGVDGAPAISAGAGMLAITGPAGSATAVQVVAATEPPVGYQISATKQVTYLERSADELTLTTGGKARVRLTFDQETGALLRSETLNSDGSVYCTTSMTSFVSAVPKVPDRHFR